MVVRYLSTKEREDIVQELEREVGGEPPIIRTTATELAIAAQQYTKAADPRRIPTVRQSIQRRRITPIPTIERLRPCHYSQTRRTELHLMQGLPNDTRGGRGA